MFQVTVKTLDGRDSAFTIEDEEMTIRGFKDLIEERLGIAADQQRLIFQGRVLQDEHTLIATGIQGSVIHLVAKPPPPVTREQQSTATTTTTNANISMDGSTLGEFNLQQAIQDITTNLLGGVGEISRVSNFPLSAERDADESQPDHSVVSMRQNTFENLHRQAIRLLRKINQSASTATAEGEDNNSPMVSCTNVANYPMPTSSSTHHSRDLTSSVENLHTSESIRNNGADKQMKMDTQLDHCQLDSSPMHVDEDNKNFDDDDATADRTPGPSTQQQQATSSSVTENEANHILNSTDTSLAGLANMLRRHRQLWKQAEPLFEQWEAMLVAESKARNDSNTKQPDTTSQMTDSEKKQETETVFDEQSTSWMNSTADNDSSVVWRQRLFSQISRLLHLNAHMLHLISDFSVVTMRENETAQNSHQPAETPTTTTTAGAAVTSTSNVTISSSSSSQAASSSSVTPMDTDTTIPSEPSKLAADSSSQHPHRILTVPEVDRRWMRARINIEPSEVAIIGSTTIDSSRPLFTSSLYRNRSRSASNISRSSDTAAVDPATTTTSTPTITTTTATTIAPSHNTGRTAIIHRVDIPIISMNMINVPTASFMSSLLPPSSATPVATTNSTATLQANAVATTSVTGVISTNPLISSTHTSSTATTATTDSTIPLRPLPTPLSFSSSIDPFLHCNSRHFTHHGVSSTSSHGLFGAPLTSSGSSIFASFVDVHSRSRTTAPTATPSLASRAQPVMSTTTVSSSTNVTTNTHTTTTNTSSTNATSGFGEFTLPAFNLPQQIASFVSAAASAAVSAAAGAAAGHSPFNVLVSSSPIQFSVNTSMSSAHRDMSNPSGTSVGDTNVTNNYNQTPVSSTRSAAVVERQRPSWATSSELLESNLTGLFRIITVFIEGLMKTICSRLSGAARNVCLNNQSPCYSTNECVSVGLLIDVISTVCKELASQASSSSPISSNLDGMREQLQHLLNCADSAVGNNQLRLIESLINCIFQGITSDDCNREYTNWITNFNLNQSNRRRICDVTASFVKLFKHIISSQLELWRASPTNVGFGSTILMTLRIACIDLLCLTDLLTNELCLSLGISLPVSIDYVGTTTSQHSPNDPHGQLFGFSWDFKELLDHLNSFLQEYESDDQYSEFCQNLITGLDRCINSYFDLDESSLKAKIAHHRTFYLAMKDVGSRSLAGSVDSNLVDEDMNGDDLPFVDACSDLPTDMYMNSQHSNVSTRINGVTAEKEAALPDWTPKRSEIPDDWKQALRECNPQSLRQMSDHPYKGNAEGWHAVLPPAWIHVVTEDVANMATGLTPDGINDSDTPGRFSDGYISGMPAKRRKVMQEHNCSVFQSPNRLFTECLSNALGNRTTEQDCAVQTSNSIRTNSSSGVGSSSSSNTRCQSSSESTTTVNGTTYPAADKELVSALRDIVSDRIGTRLATDPDFDPVQFPLTSQKFRRTRNN